MKNTTINRLKTQGADFWSHYNKVARTIVLLQTKILKNKLVN